MNGIRPPFCKTVATRLSSNLTGCVPSNNRVRPPIATSEKLSPRKRMSDEAVSCRNLAVAWTRQLELRFSLEWTGRRVYREARGEESGSNPGRRNNTTKGGKYLAEKQGNSVAPNSI
eukprot:scaffold1054_cov281-Alexandrium_tamarense.AAC.6